MESMLQSGVEQCPQTLGLQNVVSDLRQKCRERLTVPEEFLKTCLLQNAGSEVMNKLR